MDDASSRHKCEEKTLYLKQFSWCIFNTNFLVNSQIMHEELESMQ